jgi:hypothetical protein
VNGSSLERRPGASLRITARDLEILRFLGRLRFASADQLCRAFAMSRRMVYRRCRGLCAAALLQHTFVLHGQPGVYLATAAGLGLADLDLPPARVDLLNFRHHLAVVSLSLDLASAHPGSRWVSERELRHELGGQGGVGMRVHVPDGALVLPDGSRQAIELELTAKTARRLSGILRHWARSRDYQAVRYFVTRPAEAARLGRLFAPYPYLRVELWAVPPEAGGGA